MMLKLLKKYHITKNTAAHCFSGAQIFRTTSDTVRVRIGNWD